jgi:hypothetical protein
MIRYDRTAMAPYQALLAGADAGHWDLPPAIPRLRRAEAELRRLRDEARTALASLNLAAATSELADRLVDAALARRKIEHPGAPLADVAARGSALATDEAVLSEAVDVAAERLLGELSVSDTTLVVEHLRPAFDAVVAEVRKLAPHLAGLDLASGPAMARASDEGRAALRRLEELLPRWSAIRNAHERLLGIGRESGAYSLVRNIDEFFPQRHAVMGKVPPPPWPSDPIARLLWYVTTEGVELWLPTLVEEQAVYQAAEDAKPRMPRLMPTTVGARSAPRQNVAARSVSTPSRVVTPSE